GGVTLILRPINILASFVILRLLNPDEVGAVALAMLLLVTSNLFAGLGMGMAVIHSKIDKRKTAFHAFVMMMASATAFFLLVFTNVRFFAGLLGDVTIAPILRVMSYYILIDTASTIPVSLLRKELKFERVGVLSLVAELVYTAVSITLAFMGFGLWSLVIAKLAFVSVRTILSWLLCPGWDWLRVQRWDNNVARGLLTFGLRSTGSGLVAYFHTHWDDWLVGSSLGKAALGFYSKGYDLTNNTMNQLSNNVIGVVFFPSYAKIQDDPERLSRAYLKSVRLVMLIMVPMALGLFSVAPEMVFVFWQEKWMPMVPVLQIYAFMLLTRPISENAAPLFSSVGKPQYNMLAGVVLIAVMIPLALILLVQGFVGVAIAVVIAHLVGVMFNVFQMNRLLPGTAKETLKIMLPIVGVGVLMMSAVFLAKAPIQQLIGGDKYNLFGLMSLVVVGALVYLPAIFLTQRALLTEIIQMVLSVLGPRLRRIGFAHQR
ncbi:MAG: lipopolysaccharide biosynthesis protein, partial [Anaerolineales bacterium]|nr:lipopolysaccharide biosynthesis protein [Anaerolineales bacterium]